MKENKYVNPYVLFSLSIVPTLRFVVWIYHFINNVLIWLLELISLTNHVVPICLEIIDLYILILCYFIFNMLTLSFKRKHFISYFLIIRTLD